MVLILLLVELNSIIFTPEESSLDVYAGILEEMFVGAGFEYFGLKIKEIMPLDLGLLMLGREIINLIWTARLW